MLKLPFISKAANKPEGINRFLVSGLPREHILNAGGERIYSHLAGTWQEGEKLGPGRLETPCWLCHSTSHREPSVTHVFVFSSHPPQGGTKKQLCTDGKVKAYFVHRGHVLVCRQPVRNSQKQINMNLAKSKNRKPTGLTLATNS